MEKLKELAQLVTGIITPDNLRNLFRESTTDPKAYIFLDGILSSRFKSDEEAAEFLYKSNPADKKYQMLKSRTKTRLLQLVFSMDLSKRLKSNFAKALHSCHKNLFAIRQLILLGHRNLVAESLLENYSLAKRFHLTDLQLTATRLLRDHAAFSGNVKMINSYNDEIDSLKKRLDDELESEKCFQKMRGFLRASVNISDESLNDAAWCFKRVKQLFRENKLSSNSIAINYFRIAIYYYHFLGNSNKVLETCAEFENYLIKNPKFADLGLLTEVEIQRLDTSLYLKNYELGKKSASNCLKVFKKNITNWIVVQELYFMLCLHTENYLSAVQVLEEVKANKYFSEYPEDRKERWKIFEAFLSYILPADSRLRKFNVHKFVNEVPVFSKDKIGFNLSIIIAQVLLLVKEGDFDRVMDKSESLRSYARRHIDKIKNPRSFYFVKMLLTMIRCDFDSSKTIEATEKFVQLLYASKEGNRQNIETMEIIPYNILWNDLMEKLQGQKANMIHL